MASVKAKKKKLNLEKKDKKSKKSQPVSKKKDLSKITRCPACGSENIAYLREEDSLICRDCGEKFAELAPEDEVKYEKASDVI